MKPVRALALRKETLAELSAADLAVVHGAAAPKTIPLGDCVDLSNLPGCASVFEPCISWGTCTTY